ncbi:hypothetical protein GGI12_005134, partial [Dipsacomyces acuminosporus]
MWKAGLKSSSSSFPSRTSAARIPRLHASSSLLAGGCLSAAHRARTPAVAQAFRRHYHENVVYGYRIPKEFAQPDYSAKQLKNRQEQAALVCLVNAYRSSGHKVTDLDPLGMQKKQPIPELDPARYGFNDMNQKFDIDGILSLDVEGGSSTQVSMAEIHKALTDIYC